MSNCNKCNAEIIATDANPYAMFFATCEKCEAAAKAAAIEAAQGVEAPTENPDHVGGFTVDLA